MNCAEFRARVGAEPNASQPELHTHTQECVACARYLEQLKGMDQLIYRALQIDVVPAAPAVHARPRILRRPVWSVAASVLMALFIATTFWLLGPRETFARQLIEHVEHEPGALVRTSSVADAAHVKEVLSAAGVELRPGMPRVSYARSCEFRGHLVPHLVVQSEQGPVTVLVLPHAAQRSSAEQITENGFQGVIVPAPRGVVVVLGQGVAVETVTQTVMNALDYELG